jgi:hypothetical protein
MFTLKKMFLRSFLAVALVTVPGLVVALPAAAQVQPSSTNDEGAQGQATANPKYEIYAGWAYTSLNQVNQSRFGLQGVDLNASREWGKYFALSLMINYYKPKLSFGSGGGSDVNPGDPSVYNVIIGPEVHAPIYNNIGGFIHGGIGGEHTGGEGVTPNISFSGGFGGGLFYRLSDRWSVRASGDRIGQSFSLRNNTPILGYSPHRTWNNSATIGVAFRF